MPRFTPRVRKQKALKRISANNGIGSDDRAEANAETILPEEQRLRRAKHEALKAELKAGQPKFSAKKQKRLDKYIENKLKKDENLELLKKLGAAKTDTTQLRSSRTLGAGRRHPEPAESSDVESTEWEGFISSASSSDEDGRDGDSRRKGETSTSKQPLLAKIGHATVLRETLLKANGANALPTSALTGKISQTAGSGLKRPLDLDSSGHPVIQKRPRLNQRLAATHLQEIMNDALRESASTSGSESSLDTSEGESDDLSEDVDVISSTDSDSGQTPRSLFALPRPESGPQHRRNGVREILEDWTKEASGFENPVSHLEAIAQLPAALQASNSRGIDRATETEPLPAELQVANGNPARTAHHIQVNRNPSIEDSRLKLPVVVEEQKIMEAIHNNPAVVVCGATGSGKTTQIPQFLFESGYGAAGGPTPGMIGVTQPRRVAAVTMAKRVKEEMGDQGDRVAYQIRFDSTANQKTSIKYMTDGILLREISEDFILKKYSAIVIDEAHERSVNTDILIGMLSRVVGLREEMSKNGEGAAPLKLIIMSATLAAGDFVTNERLFQRQKPPLIEAEGRQYEVVEHFARRTQQDYLEQAYQKITRGHQKLPPGSMLVFLTGPGEIATLSKRLVRAFGAEASSDAPVARMSGKDIPLEADDLELGEDRIEDYGGDEDDVGGETNDEGFDIDDSITTSLRAKILPLYSQLPTTEQQKVFEPSAEDVRVIILATNVAETSITIPNIRYVFDCGRSKAKKCDPRTGVQSFEIGWISKASAAQRLGRAGRTGPGHCYRLYSSAIYEAQFTDHTPPEIASAPIDGVVLTLTKMQIPGGISKFPFPTPPDTADIVRAERRLANLGAISTEGKITEVGEAISHYPISPRFARILVDGLRAGHGHLTAALVAAMATPEMFIAESQLDLGKQSDLDASDQRVLTQSARLAEDARAARRKSYNSVHAHFAKKAADSDALKLLCAFRTYFIAALAHEASIAKPSAASNLTNTPSPESECARLFLRPRACAEARKLYEQLIHVLIRDNPTAGLDRTCPPPPQSTPAQSAALKGLLTTGFVDQIAVKLDMLDDAEQARIVALHPGSRAAAGKPPRSAAEVPYVPLFGGDVLATVHPSSVLAHGVRRDMPSFIVYERLQAARPRAAATLEQQPGRTTLFPLAPVTAEVLRSIASRSPLLEWGKPIGKIQTLPSVGVRARRKVWAMASLVNTGERGAQRRRLPLPPAEEVVQIRDKRGEWHKEIS